MNTVSKNDSSAIVSAQKKGESDNSLNLNHDVLKIQKTWFVTLCEEVIKNPSIIPLPGSWVPQVILQGVQCIMWSEYEQGYSKVIKRVVLLSNMSVEVR